MTFAHTLINHQSIGSVSYTGSSYILNTGTIAGSFGIEISGGIGKVVNNGNITGTASYGIELASGGSVLFPARCRSFGCG